MVKSIFADGRGFTTTELLVASLFALVVLATLYGFYRDQLYHFLSQETKTATLEDARGAMDMMVRELRNAGAWTSGVQPGGCQKIVAAMDTAIRIQADLDGDDNCTGATGEDVTYELSGATSTCPGTIIRRRGSAIDPGQCFVANVLIPSGNSFLTYYPSGTNPAPYCFSTGNPVGCSGDLAANLANIKRIKITFAVQLTNPNPNARAANPNISTTLSSSVQLRNP